MKKGWVKYWSSYPYSFIEKYLNIKLTPLQKFRMKLYNKKLDKQAISDMAKYYNQQSRVYMDAYYFSSMGSKYGYDRCKMAEEVVNEIKYR